MSSIPDFNTPPLFRCLASSKLQHWSCHRGRLFFGSIWGETNAFRTSALHA